MSDAKDFKFSLKVMINKQKTKVLYAEADSDFVVLLSFLTLPLGTIVRVLEKYYGDEAPVIGSITTLYNGLANLDSSHFWTESGKQMLMNPRNSSEIDCRKLKLNVDDTPPTIYFKCADKDCSFERLPNKGIYYSTLKCDCGKSALCKGLILEDCGDGDGGVFTTSKTSFIISDDLQILPSVTGHAIRILRNLGITDTDGTELRNVTFGFNEVMDLLKGSLLSPTPLTYLILNKRQVDSVTAKYETCTIMHQIKEESTSKTKKMTVKAILQKSTNIFLLAEADGDFLEFLFSLLTIPLGGVECLLDGRTSLKSVDNLYMSIADINGDMYLKTKDTKTMLLEPKLPLGYISKRQILPLKEERGIEFMFKDVLVSSVKSPKGPGNYVKLGPTMYMVTDDLTVTPLCTTSSLSILNRLKIPLSDVKELELDMGLEQALNILRASLTSTSALTDGLINPTLKKQPKLEH